MVDGECKEIGGLLDREAEVLAQKPAPVQLCPPQIPHDVTRTRTQAAAVRSRQLTAWATAQHISYLRIHSIIQPYMLHLSRNRFLQAPIGRMIYEAEII
jgi:hypothetical protein